MPTDACLFFHACPSCGVLLRPQPGDCCVFCSYGSVPCPPVQVAGFDSVEDERASGGYCCAPPPERESFACKWSWRSKASRSSGCEGVSQTSRLGPGRTTRTSRLACNASTTSCRARSDPTACRASNASFGRAWTLQAGRLSPSDPLRSGRPRALPVPELERGAGGRATFGARKVPPYEGAAERYHLRAGRPGGFAARRHNRGRRAWPGQGWRSRVRHSASARWLARPDGVASDSSTRIRSGCRGAHSPRWRHPLRSENSHARMHVAHAGCPFRIADGREAAPNR